MDQGDIPNSESDSRIEKKQQIEAEAQLGRNKNFYTFLCDTFQTSKGV